VVYIEKRGFIGDISDCYKGAAYEKGVAWYDVHDKGIIKDWRFFFGHICGLYLSYSIQYFFLVVLAIIDSHLLLVISVCR
jgi:hypothetical protein